MSFVEDLQVLVANNAAGVLSSAPHWPRVSLGEVARVINGFAFPSKNFKAESGTPLIRIRDVVGGCSDTLYDGPIPDGYWVDDGDLLVGMDGDFNCATWRGGRALLNQRVCKIVPDESRLRKAFLLYALPGYLKLINDYTSSVTVKHLSSRTLQQIPLPLPAVEEQDRLLARIDALFVEIEAGEAALAEARSGVETYRKALLKAAVTGELTADWRRANPPQETGEQLLARILSDRRARWQANPKNARKKYTDPTPPDTEGLPELPDGWTWARLEQLGLIENGQTPRGVEDCTMPNGDIPWFKVSSMNKEGNELFLQASEWWLSLKDTKKIGLHVRPAGTIVFPKRGGAIHTNKKRRLAVPGAFDLNTMGFVPVETYADFCWLVFSNLDLSSIADGSNVPQINYPDVADLIVAVPPVAEAKEISASADMHLKRQAELQKNFCDWFEGGPSTLRQSILAAAFRGDLIP